MMLDKRFLMNVAWDMTIKINGVILTTDTHVNTPYSEDFGGENLLSKGPSVNSKEFTNLISLSIPSITQTTTEILHNHYLNKVITNQTIDSISVTVRERSEHPLYGYLIANMNREGRLLGYPDDHVIRYFSINVYKPYINASPLLTKSATTVIDNQNQSILSIIGENNSKVMEIDGNEYNTETSNSITMRESLKRQVNNIELSNIIKDNKELIVALQTGINSIPIKLTSFRCYITNVSDIQLESDSPQVITYTFTVEFERIRITAGGYTYTYNGKKI